MDEASQPELELLQLWHRCRDNPTDSYAWEDFLKRLLPGLRGILWNSGVRTRADIDELSQDVVVKLWKLGASRRRVPEEESKLRKYFRAIAANTARSWMRRTFGRTRNQDLNVPIDDRLHTLADEIGLKHVERELLIRQIEKRLGGSSRDQYVFWLYYRQGFTAAAIAAIAPIGLSVKGVEALIHRMTVDLREGLR